ncbi:MAG: hypothetical protein BWZ10_02631 [candidate division BRC1 bacterium ADurb.BinA364]|nr:MAG: hypothetical protein BWZ10_02631 [candidate division BRC1 bacterium ADurb.BinA364]
MRRRTRHSRPRQARHAAPPAKDRQAAIALVAGERFVAAVAVERHGHLPPRHFGQDQRRHGRHIGVGLVEMPGQPGQRPRGVGADNALLMPGLAALGDLARIGQLVVALLLEADGEGAQSPAGMPAGHRDDNRGIDAAAQEHSQRHIALQPQARRFVDQRIGALGGLGGGNVQFRLVFQRPVAPDANAALFPDQGVGRGQFADVAVDGRGGGDILMRQEIVNRALVHAARDFGIDQQRLHLGGEPQGAAGLGVVERLFANAVARQQQPPAARIPDRQGEHAAQLRQAFRALFLVEMNDRLGVAVVGGEAMAAGGQRRAQFAKIVNLAVEHNGDGAVLVEHRLGAAGQVDDAQAAVAQPGRTENLDPFAIRPAMGDGAAHRANPLGFRPVAGIGMDDAAYSAHKAGIMPKRGRRWKLESGRGRQAQCKGKWDEWPSRSAFRFRQNQKIGLAPFAPWPRKSKIAWAAFGAASQAALIEMPR